LPLILLLAKIEQVKEREALLEINKQFFKEEVLANLKV
jgi:hypothetical protein